MTIGILGGSFDPPHQGHILISQTMHISLKLNQIWWLVTPQNPFKHPASQPIDIRIKTCKTYVKHITNIHIFDTNIIFKTDYTIDTITTLQRYYPNIQFIWLLGADSFMTFHDWKKWQEIMYKLPLAIYPRSPSTLKAGGSLTAQTFSQARYASSDASLLKSASLPAWSLINGTLHPESSTPLRKKHMPIR